MIYYGHTAQINTNEQPENTRFNLYVFLHSSAWTGIAPLFPIARLRLDMLGYICKKRTLGAFTRTYIQKLPSTCLRVRGSTCSVWQAEPIKTTPGKIVRLMHTISLSFCHVSQFDRCTTRRSMCCPNRVLAWYARLF